MIKIPFSFINLEHYYSFIKSMKERRLNFVYASYDDYLNMPGRKRNEKEKWAFKAGREAKTEPEALVQELSFKEDIDELRARLDTLFVKHFGESILNGSESLGDSVANLIAMLDLKTQSELKWINMLRL